MEDESVGDRRLVQRQTGRSLVKLLSGCRSGGMQSRVKQEKPSISLNRVTINPVELPDFLLLLVGRRFSQVTRFGVLQLGIKLFCLKSLMFTEIYFREVHLFHII